MFSQRAANGLSLLQTQRPQHMRVITEVAGIFVMVHRTHTGIMESFIRFLREKFDITVLEDHCVYELGKKIRGPLLP